MLRGFRREPGPVNRRGRSGFLGGPGRSHNRKTNEASNTHHELRLVFHPSISDRKSQNHDDAHRAEANEHFPKSLHGLTVTTARARDTRRTFHRAASPLKERHAAANQHGHGLLSPPRDHRRNGIPVRSGCALARWSTRRGAERDELETSVTCSDLPGGLHGDRDELTWLDRH